MCDPDGDHIVLRFDMRNPAAESWLGEHSSTLVTNIVEDQCIAILAALEDGLARGDNPTEIAVQRLIC